MGNVLSGTFPVMSLMGQIYHFFERKNLILLIQIDR